MTDWVTRTQNGNSWTKMPYPLLTSLFSSVKNPHVIRMLPPAEWQHSWQLSEKGRCSEGSTRGSGWSPQTSVMSHSTSASRPFLLVTHHIYKLGRNSARTDYSRTSGSTFAFYYVSLGWKDWGPQMCLEEHKDSSVLSDLWGCWMLTMENGSPYHPPLQEHSQLVSLCLFSVTAQTYSEFFTLSYSLNHFAYSNFSFL